MNRRTKARLMALAVTVSLLGTLFGAGPVSAADAPQMAPTAAGKGDAPVVVAVKITQDQAIATAKAAFTIPEGLELTVNKNSGQYGATWNLNWNSPEKAVERIGISVTVDGVTGVITSYNRYENKPEEANLAPAAYSREDAAPVAEGWLSKLAADVKDSLRLAEQPLTFEMWGPMQTSYTFNWQRMEQGYPSRNGGVSITMDARTNQLMSYQRNLQTNITYVTPEKVATRDQAMQAYRALPMQLAYQYYQKPASTEGEWRLIYRPATGFFPPLSQDGVLLNYQGKVLDLKRLANLTPLPAPDKPYKAPERPLTEQEALALAQQVAGRTDQPTSSSCNESSKGEEKSAFCSYNWSAQGELKAGEYNTDVQIDLHKGVAASYNSWGLWSPIGPDEKIITEDEARQNAVDFIRTVRPDLVSNLMLMPPTADQDVMLYKVESYQVTFAQMKNGIPFADRQLSVQVDARNGHIRNFWANDWGIDAKTTFPQANYVIKPEEALDAFLKVQGLELGWQTLQQPYFPGKTPAPADNTYKANLYWLPASKLNVVAIDANTGAPLDYQGRNLIELTTKPTDIAGHFAEKEINLLWSRGVFSLKDGKFNPNGTLSMAELSRWLILARGMQPYPTYNFASMGRGEAMATKMAQAADAPYIGAALQNGIILPEDLTDDTDPNAPVTREQVALWAVRAMGYGAIAKMPNRIDMPFTDKDQIGDRYVNAVAILHGLGVIKGGSDSRFAPQRLITRGEAAKILFAVANQVRRYY
ncbi:MAG: YcdB/YcdC domain-containing protein [Mycobacterium leprae]